MPIYTYVCKDCGKDLEVRQDFHDTALTVCPHCAGQLRKSFNAVGVVFKGSGFYRNDSREQSTKRAEKAGRGSSDAGGDSSSKESSVSSSDKGSSDGSSSERGSSGRESSGGDSGANGTGSGRGGRGSSAGSSSSSPATSAS